MKVIEKSDWVVYQVRHELQACAINNTQTLHYGYEGVWLRSHHNVKNICSTEHMPCSVLHLSISHDNKTSPTFNKVFAKHFPMQSLGPPPNVHTFSRSDTFLIYKYTPGSVHGHRVLVLVHHLKHMHHKEVIYIYIYIC